jgi:hypothetical protein
MLCKSPDLILAPLAVNRDHSVKSGERVTPQPVYGSLCCASHRTSTEPVGDVLPAVNFDVLARAQQRDSIRSPKQTVPNEAKRLLKTKEIAFSTGLKANRSMKIKRLFL